MQISTSCGKQAYAHHQSRKLRRGGLIGNTHPHGRVQHPGNLVVLLEPRATAQDLGQPELADGALHVADLALGGRGGAHPLRRLAAHAAHHVGMGQRLGCPLGGLDVERGGDGLGDARVQRRGAARDDQRVLGDGLGVARRGPVPRAGAERGVVAEGERGAHGGGETRLLLPDGERGRGLEFRSLSRLEAKGGCVQAISRGRRVARGYFLLGRPFCTAINAGDATTARYPMFHDHDVNEVQDGERSQKRAFKEAQVDEERKSVSPIEIELPSLEKEKAMAPRKTAGHEGRDIAGHGSGEHRANESLRSCIYRDREAGDRGESHDNAGKCSGFGPIGWFDLN